MGYYQGDFYRGDPGLFSVIGRIGRGIVRAGKSYIGIPERAAPAAAGIAKLGSMGAMGAIVKRGTAAIAKHPVLSAAGAAGIIGVLGGRAEAALARQPAMTAMGGMRGFHISKKTGVVVKNRRMRVTNPKALRRAIRRANGFAHLARKVLRFTSPRAPRGRAVFKSKRRKRVA